MLASSEKFLNFQKKKKIVSIILIVVEHLIYVSVLYYKNERTQVPLLNLWTMLFLVAFLVKLLPNHIPSVLSLFTFKPDVPWNRFSSSQK